MECPPGNDDTFGPQYCNSFDFTLLFEQSCLQLIPCAIFLLALPQRILSLHVRNVKTSKIGILAAKITAILMLTAVNLILLVSWCSWPSYRTKASFPAAILSLLASIGLLYLSILEHSRSIRPSSMINAYVLFSLALEIPQSRTLWLRPFPRLISALFTSSLGIKLVILVLEAHNKRRILLASYLAHAPELLVSLYERTVLWWLNALFIDGYRGNIPFDRLFDIDDALASGKIEEIFWQSWLRYRRLSQHRLIRSIYRTFARDIIGLMSARICLAAITLTQPLLTRQITLWFSGERNDQDIGHGLIGATATLYVAVALTNAIYKRALDRLETKVRGLLVSSIHSRILSQPQHATDDGLVTSFLTTDVPRITDAIEAVVNLKVAPLEIGAAIFLLQREVGPSCAAPVALSLCISLLSFVNTNKALPFQADWLAVLQKRVAYTTRALGSPKSFKMLGLEEYLIDRIQGLRVSELAKYAAYRKFVAVRNMLAFMPDNFAPPITLAICASVNRGGILTPSITFTALSLVQLLVRPIHTTIQHVPECMNAAVSLHRIEKYLAQTDERAGIVREPGDQVTNESERQAEALTLSTRVSVDRLLMTPIVKFTDANFRSGKDRKAIIEGLNLTIARKVATIIIGPVGSGKSTLLRAVIRGIDCTNGQCDFPGEDKEFAYCAQDPWLTNEPVDAIIRGVTEPDEAWYASVLEVCELMTDIRSFPDRDKTVIGSNGISLSGGQRQRIALARALYSRKSILVLDDVLSGVDARSSDRIVAKLKGICRLHGITLIMATNAVQHLKHADHIVVLGPRGTVQDQGTLEDLRTRNDYLRSFQLDLDNTDLIEEPDPKEQSRPTKGTTGVITKVGPDEEQDSARGTGDFAVYKYYAGSMGWRLGAFVIISAACSSFGEKFPDVVVQRWSEDAISASPRHGQAFWIGIYFALAAFAAGSFLSHLWIFLVWTVPRSSARLHFQLLRSAMRVPYSFFVRIDMGVILNHFTTDMSMIEQQLAGNVIRTLTGISVTVFAAALIAAGTDWAGLTMPFLMLLMYVLARFYLRTSRQLRLTDLEARAPLLTHCQDTERGVMTIRAFGWLHHSHSKCLRLLDRSQRPYYLLLCVQRWLNLVLDLTTAAIATIVVALAITMSHTASAGSIGLSLLNILSFNRQLSELIVAWTDLETALGAIARCRQFCLRTLSEPVTATNETIVPTASSWPERGHIELSDLTASYQNGQQPVLKHISMAIPAGAKVGICGRSGSGKSSLLLALFRMLEPSSGKIVIDGVDLTTIPPEVIRRRFTALPQDGLCLPDTVRANLDPHKAHGSEALITALSKVGLWDLIQSRVRGGGADDEALDVDLDTLSLSQGELQLLSTARALLHPSPLLIVDEMTSAIDRATEDRIHGLVMAEFQYSTVLAVAHRLHTFADFDLLAVMDDGAIVEFGPPRELLAIPGGRFRRMLGHGDD